MGYHILSPADMLLPLEDILVDTGCPELLCLCREQALKPPRSPVLGSGRTASTPCCEPVNEPHKKGRPLSVYFSTLLVSEAYKKASVRSCFGTGESLSSYSAVAASPVCSRGACNSSLPTQPQQHRHDMELHKSSHLEIVTLITACSPDGRLAPLSPAHLWLQYSVCSSSNP